MAQTNSFNMWKKRMIAELTRDKKKACILGVLAVTAAFFVGKLLFTGSPESAGATQPPAGQAAAAELEASGGGNPRFTARVVKPHEKKKSEKRPEITRDIFRTNEKFFPLVVIAAKPDSAPNVVEGAGDEASVRLKAKKERIRKEGASLHLESTLFGRVPIAIINGAVLGKGGVIKGFRVVEIKSQTCLVEKEGIKLSLSMK
jgi:hypothetical protein